jgi:ABC-type transport system involved in multi-copper enzyme maturation permease subunit
VSRLVRAELLKLRTTRLLLWLGLLILGLEVLVISLDVSQNSLHELTQARNQRDVVSIAAISALISLILGIVSSAGEYAHGTISHTFLVAPVRDRVVEAKLVAAALAGAALALFSAAFAWGFAALLLSARSVPLHLGSGGAQRLLLGTIGAAAITGALGVGLGALVRRQTAAIVVALVWLLVAEPLLGIAGVQGFAPGHAVASVVEAGTQGSDLLGFWEGLAVVLGYVVVFGALGTLAVERTDVS